VHELVGVEAARVQRSVAAVVVAISGPVDPVESNSSSGHEDLHRDKYVRQLWTSTERNECENCRRNYRTTL